MTNKFLRVTMPNGTYDVPLEVIAKDRATYFADHDAKEFANTPKFVEEWNRVWREEFDITMDDEFEATDWASNNMNWDDIANQAVLVKYPNAEKIDMNRAWTNAKKRVTNQ